MTQAADGVMKIFGKHLKNYGCATAVSALSNPITAVGAVGAVGAVSGYFELAPKKRNPSSTRLDQMTERGSFLPRWVPPR